ncbi:MAG: hypothetical protein P8X65_07600 [Syntrophobacterales bacterium]|jgi:hypothetical protein
MKMSRFKKILGWILISSLLLAVGACATGSVGKYTPPEDPMYWQMWQNNFGGSSG